ncbi:hypothetical protein T265_13574, partial [Opisthorchis viverrini]
MPANLDQAPLARRFSPPHGDSSTTLNPPKSQAVVTPSKLTDPLENSIQSLPAWVTWQYPITHASFGWHG